MATNLKELREKHGLTQQQVADRVGFDRQTIYLAEKANKPSSLALAIELADLYGLTVDELLGRG